MQEYLDAIRQELVSSVPDWADSPQARECLGRFVGMMRYHLGWVDAQFRPQGAAESGKLLRPLLCLLACRAAGGAWQTALPAAAALELVHNFSLIHDDIEDRSTERRGRPTVWKIWGVSQAINTGDAMFVLARLALGRLATHPRFAQILQVFDRATLALTQGQFLDLEFESRALITESEYALMISGKTGALLAASTEIGAMIGASQPEVWAALAEFGRHLGRAFQITDDILGIWGDPSVTGKSAASDILSRKKTLPVIYALSRPEREALRKLYSKPSLELGDLPMALQELELAHAREYCQAEAQASFAAASRALSALHSAEAAELLDLARDTVSRTK